MKVEEHVSKYSKMVWSSPDDFVPKEEHAVVLDVSSHPFYSQTLELNHISLLHQGSLTVLRTKHKDPVKSV